MSRARTPHALLAVLSLSLLGCSDPAPTDAEGLDSAPIIVILFDAMAAGHIHHLGYKPETSPNLDALAAEGVTFTKAFAPAPYTLASIPSLFTGRLPDRHGVTQPENILPEAEVTLAETLAAQGYETFAAIANIQGGTLHNLQQGFEHYDELFKVDPNNSHGEGMRIVEPMDFVPVLADWLETRDPTRPPFIYLHVLQPHMPYSPPMEYRKGLVADNYDGVFADGMSREWMIEFANSGGRMVPGKGKHKISFRDAKAVKGLYDANIRYSDAALGRLLEVLKRSRLYDEAMILVTSDHGEGVWEQGVLGHNRNVFDEMLRVPLVIKFPSAMQVPAMRINALTSLTDIYPSICAWFDVATPQHLDGRPLPGIFGEPEDPERELFLRTFHPEPTLGLRGVNTKTVLEPPRKGDPQRIGFFELDKDPRERHPLPVLRGSPGAKQLARLEAIAAELEALGAGSVRNAEPTEAEKELIRELGYAE